MKRRSRFIGRREERQEEKKLCALRASVVKKK